MSDIDTSELRVVSGGLPVWLADYGASVIDRFMAHTERAESGCLLWTAHCIRGYGRFSQPGKSGRPLMGYAHRFAYETFVGPIPDGYEIDHLCRVTRCVEPSHLEAVTKVENLAREWADRRLAASCKRGHEFTQENTAWKPNGKRRCRACERFWNQKAREARS